VGEGAVAFTIDLAACFLFFVLKKNFVLFLELVKTKEKYLFKVLYAQINVRNTQYSQRKKNLWLHPQKRFMSKLSIELPTQFLPLPKLSPN